MAVSILDTKWIRAVEVCRRMGVDMSTVWRWHRKGLRGPDGQVHKLQVMKRPGYVATTEEWVAAFFNALRLDDGARPARAAKRAARQRAKRVREIDAANAALDRDGIGKAG